MVSQRYGKSVWVYSTECIVMQVICNNAWISLLFISFGRNHLLFVENYDTSLFLSIWKHLPSWKTTKCIELGKQVQKVNFCDNIVGYNTQTSTESYLKNSKHFETFRSNKMGFLG